MSPVTAQSHRESAAAYLATEKIIMHTHNVLSFNLFVDLSMIHLLVLLLSCDQAKRIHWQAGEYKMAIPVDYT